MIATRSETEFILNRMPLLPNYWKYGRFMIDNVDYKVHRHNNITCWNDRVHLNPMSVFRWARKNGLAAKKHKGPLDAWEFVVER